MKNSLTEYTEQEFLNFVIDICNNHSPTEEEDSAKVFLFHRLAEHPDGADLIFWPKDGHDGSPEGIVKEVKEWRLANGLPGFKAS